MNRDNGGMGFMKTKHTRLIFFLIFIFISAMLLATAGFLFGKKVVFPLFVIFFLPLLFYAIIYYLITRITAGLFWIFLPSSIKQDYGKNKKRFRSVFFVRTFFLLVFLWLLNHFIFDYSLSFASVLGNISLFMFFILSDIVFFNSKRAFRTALIASGILVFVSVFLSFIHVEKETTSATGDLETLKSLPYANWSPAEVSITKKGVVKHDPEKACKGINVFASRSSSLLQLLDMEGNVLHSWDLGRIKNENAHLIYAELLTNGDIVAIANRAISRYDKNSQKKWTNDIPAHHDIAVSPYGDIITLTEIHEAVFTKIFPIVIQNNHLVFLSPEGKIKKDLDLYGLLKKETSQKNLNQLAWFVFSPRAYARRILDSLTPPRDIYGKADIFHGNTVEWINRDVNHIFKKGRILFCSKRLNMIALIDVENKTLVWTWGKGELQRPHHPTLLPNNNILVFDNGNFREYSRILEVEPMTGKIVWAYQADPPQSFFSSWGGSNERLPNGNTLITDTDSGRVFEVTREGEIVWDFLNPVVDEENNSRANIARMMRIIDYDRYPFLKELEEQSRSGM